MHAHVRVYAAQVHVHTNVHLNCHSLRVLFATCVVGNAPLRMVVILEADGVCFTTRVPFRTAPSLHRAAVIVLLTLLKACLCFPWSLT